MKKLALFLLVLIFLLPVAVVTGQDPTAEPTPEVVPGDNNVTVEDGGIIVQQSEPVVIEPDKTQTYTGWAVAVVAIIVAGVVMVTGNAKLAALGHAAANMIPIEFAQKNIVKPLEWLHAGSKVLYDATGAALQVFRSTDPQETAEAIRAGQEDVVVPKEMSAETLKRFLG